MRLRLLLEIFIQISLQEKRYDFFRLPSMTLTPETCQATHDTSDRIPSRARRDSDGSCRTILLMVEKQDKYFFDRANNFSVDQKSRIHLISKHHVEEVLHEVEVIPGLQQIHSVGYSVGVGNKGWYF